ncbi:MAG: lipase [Mogibacterium sp.]|nr:lipase [Mogibacterium sp.]
MKILCIGDSNTYGYDPRSYFGSRYPEEVRWTGRLTGHEVINCGVNGATVPRDSSRHAGLIRLHEPDLVTVMLGTNDLCSGLSAEETAGRMDAFIGSIMSSGKKILLISPPLLQPGEWTMDDEALEESQSIGELYKKTASVRGCRFADSAEWDIDISFDGVHFSPEGHARFAEKLNEILNIISF